MVLQGSFPLVKITEVQPGIFDATLSAPQVAAEAQPGQFLHIGAPGFFLRRPISICGIDHKAGTLRLVFQIRGAGTRALAGAKAGCRWDVLGPVGRGFQLAGPEEEAVVVGGGIGVPPLLEAARAHRSATAFLGFASKDAVILEEDFRAAAQLTITTDDGSYGRKGLCVAPLEEYLAQHTPGVIYACGPSPMLKAVARLALQRGIPCQVSLEERMGCGVGACLGCACAIRTAAGAVVYKRVCADGPVFSAKEVVFDE